jgi:hypothetical protein
MACSTCEAQPDRVAYERVLGVLNTAVGYHVHQVHLPRDSRVRERLAALQEEEVVASFRSACGWVTSVHHCLDGLVLVDDYEDFVCVTLKAANLATLTELLVTIDPIDTSRLTEREDA